MTFAYGALTLYDAPSQKLQLIMNFVTASTGLQSNDKVAPQPQQCNACRLLHTVGLGCSPFARRY